MTFIAYMHKAHGELILGLSNGWVVMKLGRPQTQCKEFRGHP
jgi:hypothetical protein